MSTSSADAAPTILIIDDNPDMAFAVSMPLEAAGYQVAWAQSGREGLERVLEIARPAHPRRYDGDEHRRFSGLPDAAQPRSSSPYARFRDIPILMLTAIHTTTSLRFGPHEAYLPVDDFVEKPVDADVLLEKVKTLLADRTR